MTVADLKKYLENVPDDYTVMAGIMPRFAAGIEIRPDSSKVVIA